MSERLFEAFLPELSFQYEENVLMRYAGVRRRFRDLSEIGASPQLQLQHERGISKLLRRWRSRSAVAYWPEQQLLSSPEFREIYVELNSRFERGSGRRLLLASIEPIEKFCATQRRLRPILEAGHERLATALGRNAAEEFKVQESRALWEKVQGEMRASGIMARLNLADIKNFKEYDVVEAVPEIVRAGAVLYTLVMVADRSSYSSEPMK